MAKKEKKPVLNLDDKEYIIEDMTDGQKQLAESVAIDQNHVNDIQNKINNNIFINQQLVACLGVFSEKHQKGVMELRKSLEPEEVEAA